MLYTKYKGQPEQLDYYISEMCYEISTILNDSEYSNKIAIDTNHKDFIKLTFNELMKYIQYKFLNKIKQISKNTNRSFKYNERTHENYFLARLIEKYKRHNK